MTMASSDATNFFPTQMKSSSQAFDLSLGGTTLRRAIEADRRVASGRESAQPTASTAPAAPLKSEATLDARMREALNKRRNGLLRHINNADKRCTGELTRAQFIEHLSRFSHTARLFSLAELGRLFELYARQHPGEPGVVDYRTWLRAIPLPEYNTARRELSRDMDTLERRRLQDKHLSSAEVYGGDDPALATGKNARPYPMGRTLAPALPVTPSTNNRYVATPGMQ